MFKILNFFLSILKNKVGYQGSYSQNDCQNSKQRRPWSDCSFRSSMIWVCTVCLGIFWQAISVQILDHLSDFRFAFSYHLSFSFQLTICIQETPKQILSIMRHFIRVYTAYRNEKKVSNSLYQVFRRRPTKLGKNIGQQLTLGKCQNFAM